MNQEYDFTNPERGKCYYPDQKFNIPIYLDPDVAEFMQKLAGKKQGP